VPLSDCTVNERQVQLPPFFNCAILATHQHLESFLCVLSCITTHILSGNILSKCSVPYIIFLLSCKNLLKCLPSTLYTIYWNNIFTDIILSKCSVPYIIFLLSCKDLLKCLPSTLYTIYWNNIFTDITIMSLIAKIIQQT